MTPLVSVAIVNWNGERFIHRCLEHVFAQTHRDLDVIIIDNGSSDGSAEYPATSGTVTAKQDPFPNIDLRLT